MKRAFLGLILAAAISPPTLAIEEPVLTQEQKNVSDMLNQAQVSIGIISEYNNRAILDREYSAIINNFNLRQIPNRELVDLLTSLMDSLVSAKLTDREKEFIGIKQAKTLKNRHHELTKNSLTSVATASIAAGAGNPMALMGAAGTVATGYWDYKAFQTSLEEEKEEANWEIDNKVMSDLNEINKNMLSLSWELYNKYNIPDKRRLTENDIAEIISINQESDARKKYRLLNREDLKLKFAAHAPYWYHLGLASHKMYNLDNNEKYRKAALDAYEAYEITSFKIFKKDEMLTSAKLGRAQLLDLDADEEEIASILDELHKNPPQNWMEITTLAIMFAKTGDFEKSRKWAQHNVDKNKNTKAYHQQILGKLLLEQGDQAQLDNLIKEILNQHDGRVMEVLDMLGRNNVGIAVAGIEPDLIKIKASIEKKRVFDSTLTIQLPASLNIDGGDIYAGYGKYFYNPEISSIQMPKTDKLYPESVEMDKGNRFVTFIFESGKIDQWLDKEFPILSINFETESNSMVLFYELDCSEDSGCVPSLEIITLNLEPYYFQNRKLVNGKDQIIEAFMQSLDGHVYTWAKINNHPEDFRSMGNADKLRFVFKHADKADCRKICASAVGDVEVSYHDIVSALSESKTLGDELDKLPFSAITSSTEADVENKALSYLEEKLNKSLSDKTKKMSDIIITFPDRWRFNSELEGVLKIGEAEFRGVISNSEDDPSRSYIRFEDAYNAVEWQQNGTDGYTLKLGDQDQATIFNFKVSGDKVESAVCTGTKGS